MPDIDFQKIVLNLIPKKGDEPVVFYASQYETARPFIADLMWGDTEFAPGDDYWAEIDLRKNDDNIVVITDDVSIDNNEVSVILPVQAVTCIGKNLGQVKIYAADDHLIAALNFILEVQPDPLAGGVTSETAIDNLTQQIEDIATEVIGEDYYDKTDVDALLANKADASDLPDMSQYYTKTATDALLADKADKATTYTKSETDALLATKADNSDLPDMTQYYTKSEVDTLIDDIFPTLTASGDIATFTTALTKPLVSVTADPLATTITRCGINRFNEQFETGGYDNTTGEKIVSGVSSARNTTPIIVDSSTPYYFNYPNSFLGDSYSIGLYEYDSAMNFLGATFKYVNSFEFTTKATTKFVNFRIYDNGITSLEQFDNCSFNYPATNISYYAYNGQTVPVADANTLTTLSGVNNVFTDAGSVTVQYKYMSM